MKTQYSMFMTVNFGMFVVVSIVLMPFAYIMAIIDKCKHNKFHTKED